MAASTADVEGRAFSVVLESVTSLSRHLLGD